MDLATIEVEALDDIHGIPFARHVAFRDILITGPLGSGKTTLVEAIHGWSEEGYVDLAKKNWWQSRLLTFRPREIHFGVPFVGYESVGQVDWPPAPIDLTRIHLPAEKKRFFNIDWRGSFVFDFQLPPAEYIYDIRLARARKGSHRVDAALTLEKVSNEVAAYKALALHFHRNGMRVYVRDQFQGPPRQIVYPAEG